MADNSIAYPCTVLTPLPSQLYPLCPSLHFWGLYSGPLRQGLFSGEAKLRQTKWSVVPLEVIAPEL